MTNHNKKITVNALRKKKERGEKITVLTAYDFPLAKFINKAGVDIILVSDAVGTVGLGRSEAVSVSIEEMIYHTRACRNGAGTSLLITSLPFASYATADDAVHNASKIMKEGGADGVHIEGTASEIDIVRVIVEAGIPVLAHIGVIKQKIVRSGMIHIQGTTAKDALILVKEALGMADAGAFALILECIPSFLGEGITKSLDIPTIGIGAGKRCDGQALVTQDMLGLFKELSPRFLRVYADLESVIIDALSRFRDDVENGSFPGPENTYSIADEEIDDLVSVLRN